MPKFNAILFLTFLLCVNTLFAQDKWLDFTWNNFFVKFDIPPDFKIIESTPERFSAGNNDIVLTIIPKKEELALESKMRILSNPEPSVQSESFAMSIEQQVYWEELKSRLKDWCNASPNISCPNDIEFLPDLNGYWGAQTECTRDVFITKLLIIRDPDFPELLLYVWVQHRNTDNITPTKIIRSLRPY